MKYQIIKNKKIFITGGAGFIGTALITQLIKDNKITVYDNFHRNALKYTNLVSHKNLTLIKGDVLDIQKLKKIFKNNNYNVIIHMAAIAGVGMVISKPATTLRVNLIGTYNILEAVKNKKLERFIDFSTSEVYGPNVFRADEGGMTTQGSVSEPRWFYAVSKLGSEFLTHGYAREYRIPVVTIRPFNIYGPQQIGEGAIHWFILNALKNKDIIVHNEGDQVRSWCYIDDMIVAIVACLEEAQAVNKTFNIGNPRATCTVLDLAQKIIKLSKSKSKIKFQKIKYPDVEIRVPSIKKAEKYLKFHPKIGLEEGLIKTINWYKGHLI